MAKLDYIVLLTLFQELLRHGSCESYTSCAESVVTCAGSMRSATIQTLMGTAAKEEKKIEYCRAYTNSLQCMSNITDLGNNCRTDTDVRLPMMLLENGYGRFCKEDSFYKEYQASATCFSTNMPVTACYETYLKQAQQQARSQGTDPENFNYDELCTPITTLIHCANTAIGGTCGEGALLLAKLLYPGAMLVEIYDCMSDIRDKTGDDLYMKMTDPQDHGSYLPWTSDAAHPSLSKPVAFLLVLFSSIHFVRE